MAIRVGEAAKLSQKPTKSSGRQPNGPCNPEEHAQIELLVSLDSLLPRSDFETPARITRGMSFPQHDMVAATRTGLQTLRRMT